MEQLTQISAILDTGISSHSDLNVYHQKTYVSGTSSGNDDNGHGTHVAGIAAAKDNSFGVVGIDSGSKTMGNQGLG